MEISVQASKPNGASVQREWYVESTLPKSHFTHCMTNWPSQIISYQQVFCLNCLLDLSIGFDTLDHSILLHRLSSWFGISARSLQWFTSYLSSRTSAVAMSPHVSPSSFKFVVSFFSIYTPPLSVLSSAFITSDAFYHLTPSTIRHLLPSDTFYHPTPSTIRHLLPSDNFYHPTPSTIRHHPTPSKRWWSTTLYLSFPTTFHQ